MYRIPRGDYLAKLNTIEKNIFRTSELATLWGIENRNTLYKTISRLVAEKQMFTLQKGLYSKNPIKNIDKFELACAIAGPFSYISTETVLSNEGVIQQAVFPVTVIGTKSLQVKIGDVEVLARSLSPKYLHNREGVLVQKGYEIATKERALVDMRHYSPLYYIDNVNSIDDGDISKLSDAIYQK